MALSRRTVLVVLLVLVAAVAAVLVVVTRDDDGPPDAVPGTPTPSYYADGVPYELDGTLYVDHEPQEGSWMSPSIEGPYAAVRRFRDDGRTEVVVFHDGERVLTVIDPAQTRLARGAGVIAWTEPEGPRQTVVSYDLVTSRELGRTRIAAYPTDAVRLAAVGADGTVRYLVGHGQEGWSWTPGEEPERARVREPSGERPQPAGFSSVGAFVLLNPDHLWGAWPTDRDGRPAGGYVGAVSVQKPHDPTSRFTMQLPVAVPSAFLSWDSLTEVVVLSSESEATFTCDLVTRTCTSDWSGPNP